jgi:DNA repair protein RadC
MPPVKEMVDSLRMKDLARSERPRERLLREGPEALSNGELLAILLRTGTKGRSALHVAQEILQRAQGLEELTRASVDELCAVPGVGPDKAVTLKAALSLAQRLAREAHAEAPLLDTPERVADLLREDCRRYEVEQLQAVLVNTRRRLLRVERLSSGTLDTLLIHPREVFRAAISAGAAALILAHNHPSGDPTPSEADIRVTRDLIRAGQLLKIEVLDHIILGRRVAERERDYVSLRELGYFYS